MYVWEAHKDQIIWDMKHHYNQRMLLTAGADEVVTLWKTPNQSEIENLLEEDNENSTLEERIFMLNYQLQSNDRVYSGSPTCVEWINSYENLFVTSYNNGMIGLFDYNKAEPLTTFTIEGASTSDPTKSQINDIVSHPQLSICLTVSEDRKIQLYDIGANGNIFNSTF